MDSNTEHVEHDTTTKRRGMRDCNETKAVVGEVEGFDEFGSALNEHQQQGGCFQA